MVMDPRTSREKATGSVRPGRADLRTLSRKNTNMPTIQMGYCTNVHAGADLDQTRANLQRYAVPVKQWFRPDGPLGIGLWLSASSARALLQGSRLAEFADWLGETGLVPFTLNGFPYGDFHQRVVKHQVYQPTWADPARLAYTEDLIAIQDRLLPPGMAGSISTLPLAWSDPGPSSAERLAAAANLRRVAERLACMERERGRRIILSLEPEPGCVLQLSTDIVRFFEEDLCRGHDESPIRRHIGVCHDICHAAVMFETQTDVLHRYRDAGITVGKVQVSSAVRLPGDTPMSSRQAALAQLAEFNEDRYLHQTVVRTGAAEPVFYEDLSLALAAQPAGEWRVHFHVPIYLERFDRLEATPRAIEECLRIVAAERLTTHFEVETYAWGVLPPELQKSDLAEGIAAELAWFETTWNRISGGHRI